jgi:hypothetical protein
MMGDCFFAPKKCPRLNVNRRGSCPKVSLSLSAAFFTRMVLVPTGTEYQTLNLGREQLGLKPNL